MITPFFIYTYTDYGLLTARTSIIFNFVSEKLKPALLIKSFPQFRQEENIY